MMLKKGIVRRRATQSASRSRRNRENKAMRPLSRHVGSGGSAMMESLTSTLDRAKMKKSLLEWGDDDSIIEVRKQQMSPLSQLRGGFSDDI